MPRLRAGDDEPRSGDTPPAELVGRFRVEDWTDGTEGYAPASGKDDHAFFRRLLAHRRQREAREQWCAERGVRYHYRDPRWTQSTSEKET